MAWTSVIFMRTHDYLPEQLAWSMPATIAADNSNIAKRLKFNFPDEYGFFLILES